MKFFFFLINKKLKKTIKKILNIKISHKKLKQKKLSQIEKNIYFF